MKPHRLRRKPGASRMMWVALVLLAAVLEPVVVQASAAHEAAHLLQAAHRHVVALHGADDHGAGASHHGHDIDRDNDASRDAVASAHADPARAPAGEEGGRWHALMHQGHCCGHPTAVIPSRLEVDVVVRASSPPVTSDPAAASIAVACLLRPPISG